MNQLLKNHKLPKLNQDEMENLSPITIKEFIIKKLPPWGFSGGAVVKNLPANAGDTGSSPGLGRSHMLQSN